MVDQRPMQTWRLLVLAFCTLLMPHEAKAQSFTLIRDDQYLQSIFQTAEMTIFLHPDRRFGTMKFFADYGCEI